MFPFDATVKDWGIFTKFKFEKGLSLSRGLGKSSI